MASFWYQLPLILLSLSPALAEVRCRYNVTAPTPVTYYSCTEIANKQGISLDHFFLLNPLLDPDYTSIESGKAYCVSGTVVPTTTDGTCKPDQYVSCLGYAGGQCCNSTTWKCGNTQQDCRAGTCAHGLCDVENPSSYSLDGKCGPASGNKQCGGKWGNCCGKSNTCGTGTSFCGVGNCLYGNCTLPPPETTPQPEIPPWYFGNTTDGTCGPANDYQVCNVMYGFCCASTGKCGMGAQFCGDVCQPGYGNCTNAVVPPKGGDVSPGKEMSSIALLPAYYYITDGTCGGANGFVCKGSPYGDCCSSSGYCGKEDGHCKAGCQPNFGDCTGSNMSPDGTYGGTKGSTCTGTTFGACCLSSGLCGGETAHCGGGCQSQFGTCTGDSKTSPDGTCGGTKGYTCGSSGFGDCCSSSGFCGSETAHCSTGCQTQFGSCKGGSKASPDGTCGGTKGYTCSGSGFGDCCSSSGFCGRETAHCSAGCQTAFGTCSSGSSKISTDGTCGGSKGFICTGSGFGDCCSSSGFCGKETAHCSTGCQTAFGTCSTGTGNISPDSTCGGTKKYTCAGSSFGKCYSSDGYCGNEVTHCAQGCQTSFSSACLTGKIPTLDGTCGSKNGNRTCAGGPFNGQCCGSSGYCGTTTTHCGTGKCN
ncbi:carbohydrate-binding module family 18 protein [Sporormia fimetaria CBS 119925]|uniref:Carbohydrate-binding module family 18 protein n=1 Tax=Sporormia fimetaria CBS 119925 TaxID=1340428 RepID=A0A6A6UZF3_9PLEO|nr:carbohydrate-binding module family 18 protein [Sporormia fimetaria CBS 119925]